MLEVLIRRPTESKELLPCNPHQHRYTMKGEKEAAEMVKEKFLEPIGVAEEGKMMKDKKFSNDKKLHYKLNRNIGKRMAFGKTTRDNEFEYNFVNSNRNNQGDMQDLLMEEATPVATAFSKGTSSLPRRRPYVSIAETMEENKQLKAEMFDLKA
ncbi:hypothetical protein LOAG_12060 [Loa loa]|uniref:Uncharacterized protein n=1 Tax=Loa loa TaxID=7209 RepID=A0A1I7W1G0_LOALO|nr:hypothetical protein LOAG_12060 [Loa loa]EFO16447.1 hypothetical protein LOAG_12060 [Loa loa]